MTPEETLRHIKESKYFYMFLLVVAGVSIGLLLSKIPLIHSLAEALVIAVFLAGTVDLYLKTRLANEVARDVSPYLMAYHIPKELRDKVAQICGMEYYRYDFELGYDINEIEESSLFLVKCSVSYCVVNLFDRHIPYTHLVWVEKSRGKAPLKQIGQVGAEGVCDFQKKMFTYRENGQDTATEEPGALVWKKEILIPPKGSPPSRFWQTSYQMLPRERYEPFITTVAVVGAKVRIKHPEWLDVRVIFEHRLESDVLHRKEDPTSSVWEFCHALLPFSSITALWQPTEALEGEPLGTLPTGE